MTHDGRASHDEAMRNVGMFAARLEQPGFDFGRWVPTRQAGPRAADVD